MRLRGLDPRLAARLLWRDRGAGELHLLAASLLIGVASLTAVGFLADRIRGALAQQAVQLLGADVVLKSDYPWQVPVREALVASGVQQAETVTFPSMVLAADGGQLAEIKAVSDTYPLRGALRISSALGGKDEPATGIPAQGEVWVDERLAAQPAFAPGATVRIGQIAVHVTRVLTQEPDRSINFFGVAPRVLMNLGDLEASALIQSGSRVRYRLLLAGPDAVLGTVVRRLDDLLGRGQSKEDVQSARPEIRGALERAERFLGLAAVMTIVLSAVAVGLAARRYVQRNLDTSAILRCLGLPPGRLSTLVLLQVALVAFLAALAGIMLGFAAHAVLVAMLASLIETALPLPSWAPAGQGLLLAGILVAGFALPPLAHLRTVPPLRVLRRELGSPGRMSLAGYVTGLIALAGVILWVAQDLRLAAWVFGGLLAGALLFIAAAMLAVWLLRWLPGRTGFGGLQGVRSLAQRPLAAVLQTVALAIGGMALILLALTRGELLDTWRKAVPVDAPNRFVVGIQPDQRAAVTEALGAIAPGTVLWPMVRGRLQDVNGHAVVAEAYGDERARRLIDREFNLSQAAALPPGNTLIAGRWFSAEELAGKTPRVAASVEAGLAATLGWKVGDTVSFLVAGQALSVRIVGLRQLDWSSMRVNFFVLLPPAALTNYPASDIASFHLPAARTPRLNALIEQFPNLTVIDVTVILRQMQQVLQQVSGAVEFLFLFTLVAGVAVLYGALLSVFDERRLELAIMRALGARRAQVRRALLGELAGIGALAGLLAALAANGIGQLIARQLFELDLAFNVWTLPGAMVAGACLAALAGWRAVRALTDVPALDALRAAG